MQIFKECKFDSLLAFIWKALLNKYYFEDEEYQLMTLT